MLMVPVVSRAGASAAAVILLAVLAAPAIAQEPASDFLKRLRAAGLTDTAFTYLDRIDEFPGVAPEFRQAIDLERAQVAIDAALASRKPQRRDERFEQAERFLRQFLEQDDHPRKSEARLRLGTIQMGRAQQLMSDATDDSQRQAARESYLAAADTYETIVGQLRGKLEAMQGARIDPSKEPEKAALRTQYRTEFLNALVQAANAKYWAAMTFSDPADDGKELLEDAAERFETIYKDYGQYELGAIASMYRGRTLQALGLDDEATDGFLRLLEKRDTEMLREPKLEAASRLVGIWVDRDPPEYARAIDRGQAMIGSLRPNEKNLPVVQQLRVNLARAYLAQAADKDATSNGDRNRATANSRRLLTEAKRVPGDHLEQTNELLSSLGVEPDDQPLPTAEDPESVDEAIAIGRQIFESLSTMERSLDLLRRQEGGEGGEAATEGIAEIEAEIKQLQANGMTVLRRGVAMIRPDTDDDVALQARQMLAGILYQQGRYRDAAVVGGWIARSSPGTEAGLRNGLLALNAFQLLISRSGDATGRRMLPHVERLGGYLADTWPNDPEAAKARGVMVQLALGNDRWDEAAELIEAMPRGPEKAKFRRLLGQLTWNRSLAARRDGDDTRADELMADAIDQLQSGLAAIEGKATSPGSLQAALVLAKAQLRQNDSQAALATLDHPAYGPVTRLDEVGSPSDSFPEDLYGTELQAVVGQMTAPDADADQLLARAERAMQKLRDSISGDDAESKLLVKLVRLARDIRDQLDAASGAQKQKLVEAFRVFVDRIAESSDDPSTLQWVGTTLLEMAHSLTPPEGKPEGQAATLVASASKALQELTRDEDSASLANRYQFARALRLQGEYKRAIDTLASILAESPNMLDAQIEAARAYEQWAAVINPKYRSQAYQAALVGARPDSSGKNVIWGWGKISQMTSRDPKHRERFFEARYHVALCRFLMGRASEDSRVVEKAISDITSVASLYPELGGPEQRRRFDALLKQIQKQAGKSPTGLP